MEPQPRPGTQPTSARREGTRPLGAIVGAVLGVIGAVAAFIPGLYLFAWVLGAIAIITSVPVLRLGPDTPSFGLARFTAVAGATALVVGVVNLGITLEWFDYFTAR